MLRQLEQAGTGDDVSIQQLTARPAMESVMRSAFCVLAHGNARHETLASAKPHSRSRPIDVRT